MALDIDTVFRDNVIKGDIHSGEHDPDKAEIRSLLKALSGGASSPSLVKQTKAALDLVTPASENYGGLVLSDSDPTKNGYYYRSAAAWVKGRGFPDTFANLALGGTANAQTATVSAGVDPSAVLVYFATVGTENTGPMTLSVAGGSARDVVNAAGNALSAGEWAGTVVFFINADGDYQILFDAGAVAAAAASATLAQFWAEAASEIAIPDGSLSTAKYADASVTDAKIAPGVSSSKISYLATATDAVDRTLHSRLSDRISVKDFGALGDGSVDDSPAIRAAIAHASAQGGGMVFIPGGTYKVKPAAGAAFAFALVIPSNVHVFGSGPVATKIIHDASSFTFVRFAGDNGGLYDLQLDVNTGTNDHTGIYFGPEDETDLETLSSTQFNVVRNVSIRRMGTGIRMRCGPRVGGTDSYCYYNRFSDIDIRNCQHGIYLQAPVSTLGSGVNRNTFVSVRVGETGTNTGLWIEAGDTNDFIACSFEGVNEGTYPSATPTAIRINYNTASYGANNNRFYGVTIEAATRAWNNDNDKTEVYGGWWSDPYHSPSGRNFLTNLNPSGNVFIGAGGVPRVVISGTNGDITPALDNTQRVGAPGIRWSEIFAGNATINTSDAQEKADRDGKDVGADNLVSPLTSNEIAAASTIAREIGVFKWRDAVSEKGANARLHVGVTVQRVMEILAKENLDPGAYSFICIDEIEVDGDMKKSFGLRPTELHYFIARGQESRLAAIEAAIGK